MAEFRPGTPDQTAFLADLVAHGLLIESGVPGVYGRAGEFERVRGAFDALVTAPPSSNEPERMAFPPLLPRDQLEQIGYLKSFPHLAGASSPSTATRSRPPCRRSARIGTRTGASSSR